MRTDYHNKRGSNPSPSQVKERPAAPASMRAKTTGERVKALAPAVADIVGRLLGAIHTGNRWYADCPACAQPGAMEVTDDEAGGVRVSCRCASLHSGQARVTITRALDRIRITDDKGRPG